MSIDNTAETITAFIERWQASGAAERANYQLFLSELCDLLGVERPNPKTPHESDNSYVFEKNVPKPGGSSGFIDLYKRGCFVLEAKQGSDRPGSDLPLSEAALRRRQKRKTGTAVRGTAGWDTAMEKAHKQGQSYARNLPPVEVDGGRPPFLVVVDVGNTIALYSEFTRSGGSYIPFPDPQNYRIKLDELQDEAVRELLRVVWTDPMSLDPSRRSARVTRDIANRLGNLAKSLEGQHDPETVANFLMRCLFTMFAEDVDLLPGRSFTQLLADIRHAPDSFQPMLENLWKTMNEGGFSVVLRQQIPRFNGGLFAKQTVLPLNGDQIQLLIEAAQADWRDVEPAIFGTLLERALNPVERHKLGAHYTPRAYVERLVKPTVIEPLQAEWESVKVAAAHLADEGRSDKAIEAVETFHRRLASIRILDPACGSGNFLYVTLELMKRLEGEVLNTLHELGQGQSMLEIESVMVTPQQFLGIEVNPRAAAIAELVLWIGFLQWHLRTRGETRPPEPIIRDLHNIECRDAVLAWDDVEPLLDENGEPVTRWDGRTTKTHPITGQQVPDDTARTPTYRYIKPRPAEWPEADFIVGNPPFIGPALMRESLGDGYTEAIRHVYKHVPRSADYVMFWWHKAASKLIGASLIRFGFIATNSLRQTFNRRVLEHFMVSKSPLSLVFAVPDHPWVDTVDGAAVRISMTVAEVGEKEGLLSKVISELGADSTESDVKLTQRIGKIMPDLTIGANIAGVASMKANCEISSRGVMLFGSGFIVTKGEADNLGRENNPTIENIIRPYFNGRDITQVSRNVLVIDLYDLSIEEVRNRVPQIYQWIFQRVKPERDQNRDKNIRENWWLHGRTRPNLREMLVGLDRYIVTVETSKHRFFVMLDKSVLPDNMLVTIALEDAYFLGILSSSIHILWALAAGGTLEDRPRYNKTRCFETFPFPANVTLEQKENIHRLASQLDDHRKQQQAEYSKLTLTDMYNVLEKVRAEEALDEKERRIYDQGLIGILKEIHDELDAAVAAAYGWPPDLEDEEILQRLVDLNAQRAAEEAQGHIRWLRPEYQAPEAYQEARQATLIDHEPETAEPVLVTEQRDWPDALPERARAVRETLLALAAPATPADVAAAFKGRRTQKRLTETADLLQTLTALGQAEALEGERFTAV